MSEAGPYVIVPFLRPLTGGAGELRVRAAGAPTEVSLEITLPNGNVATSGSLGVVGGEAVSSTILFADLFAVAECGAAHLSSRGDHPIAVELHVEGRPAAAFGAADAIAGTEFRLAASDPAERFAVLANGGDSELFVFVNDKQGPFIPPGGSARIQIPVPGGPLHLLVESGDGVLAYRGAAVAPLD